MSFLASCTESLQEDGTVATQGNTRNMAVAISGQSMELVNLGSRATSNATTETTDDNDGVISDLWLVEYNESGAQIGAARYMTWSEYQSAKYLPIIVPEEDGVEYTCVIIANTHDADAEYIKTYSTLQTLQQQILSQSDILGEDKAETGNLLMNGYFKVTKETTSASCKLYRNVAKLHLTLNNAEGSGIKLKTIQLKNVPATIYYADQAVASGNDDFTTSPFPATDETEFLEMALDSLGTSGEGISAGSEAVTLDYYLPRNMRGTTATTDTLARNNNVPERATYVEVMASKVDTDGNEQTPVRYRFYVGHNTTNDFNVRANCRYDIALNFATIGNQQHDSRVEDLGKVKLATDANSFIINPLEGDAQPVYELPINRVNEFWNHTRYSEQLPDFDGQIYGSTQWEVSVLWQDKSTQLIQFCDENGNVTESTQGLYSSKGLSKNIFFKPVKGAKGNVLVAIKKKGQEECLWSWHLWLTDYNPDAATQKVNNYQKNVPGGRILRMEDGDNVSEWADNPNMYIMDRNVGATDEVYSAEKGNRTATVGLFYQWGRKDPLPSAHGNLLYRMNADGSITELEKKGSYVGTYAYNDYLPIVKTTALIAEAVQHPMNIYVTSKGWMKDSPLSYRESWPEILSPAPSGWKLPEPNTMSFIAKQKDLPEKVSYQKAHGYNAFLDKDSTVYTFFPATGEYTTASQWSGDGQQWNYEMSSRLWSASYNTSFYGYACLFIAYGGTIYGSHSAIASHGYTIRCVKK